MYKRQALGALDVRRARLRARVARVGEQPLEAVVGAPPDTVLVTAFYGYLLSVALLGTPAHVGYARRRHA